MNKLFNYELAFSRNIGWVTENEQSLLRSKRVDVMTEQALDSNPELDIKSFPNGVTQGNVDDFLVGLDLYVDGLDFFCA
jgi:tRNA A37 threonylcarbamoyladenosine dehydratase